MTRFFGAARRFSHADLRTVAAAGSQREIAEAY